MEDSDEFKWAVKVVIKRQMRDLMEQLRERGEEIAVLTVNLDDNTFSHFGSPSGEWFVSEQKNLAQNFLKFCRVKGQKGSQNADVSISSGKFSRPMSSSVKQREAQPAGTPTLTVTVPKQLAGDVTEEELASLVGRIVASQLAVQEKGDGSSSGTKFDLLVEAASHVKKNEGSSSVASTPSTRPTRKRKMSQRYKEGMSSLKKGKKSEEDDTGSEYETGHDENAIINILAELSTTILKRVKVKTSEEIPVSIEKSVLACSDQLESLAVPIIQELDEIAGGLLTKEKIVQVVVFKNEYSDLFDTVNMQLKGIEGKVVEHVETDPDFDVNLELSDNCYGDSDMEDDLPEHVQLVEQTDVNGALKILKEAAQAHEKAKAKKRLKKKKPLSKTTAFPCEHCGKKLIGRGNLVAHIKRIHYKQRDHKCVVCPKAFVTPSALESHMLAVHTRRCETCQEYVIETDPWPEGTDMKTKRSLTCQCGAIVQIYCNFGRKRAYDEEELQKKREKERTRYACQYCGKLFVRRSHCVRHTKLHTKLKDFHCKYCSQSFRWEVSLNKHVESEHKIFQDFFCKICKQTFATSIELEQHFREKHIQEIKESTHDSSPNKSAVKVIAKEVNFPAQKFVTFSNESAVNLQSFKEECDKEAAGNRESTVNLASLTTLPGTSSKAGESTVTLSRVTEETLDKTAYELVQQALQGDDMFGGGNTIIIRTINE